MANRHPKLFTEADQKVLARAACYQICDLHDIEKFLEQFKGFFHEEGMFEEHHDYVVYHNFDKVCICPVYGKELNRLFPLVWKDKEGYPQIEEDENAEYYDGDPEKFNKEHIFGIPKCVTQFSV